MWRCRSKVTAAERPVGPPPVMNTSTVAFWIILGFMTEDREGQQEKSIKGQQGGRHRVSRETRRFSRKLYQASEKIYKSLSWTAADPTEPDWTTLI